MPGILPMKVIKIGTTAQARIAQACDRCRSKKIRCDGIRPCCTQCANVGFECKTSDKLSRRAFPRGYTESLEERVRNLEAEVRELKDLLDEKDEKIDMLSRIHSNSPQSFMHTSPRRHSDSSTDINAREQAIAEEAEESFNVRQSPTLLGDGSESYFAGTSSACNFVESFMQQAATSGYSLSKTDSTQLLTHASTRRASDTPSIQSTSAVVFSAPPRLLSDQLINVFFQEWAPLFPVLHRPAFLATYEKYVANADTVTDNAQLAHLNLVFAIAATSSGTGADDLNSFETQWKAAIDAIINDSTIETLQALVLAQIQCLQRNDLARLLSYKGLSTSLSTRLGLHQIQKTFSLDTLTSETRKKLFWTLYTVDCFSSVVLGLPKHIKDTDVFCEYPVDADDEYVSERGFQPTLPGESTKLSSALALFKASRILSRVLDQVFPAKVSFDLSLKNLSDFSDELEQWEASLPAHLRLPFAQDKPSTGTITSRSPMLSLVYHYIRALIQRPAIASTSLGNKASSALLTHASSCKRMVQIVQLLEERGLSFSMCLNKNELLVLCGVGTLFQRLKLSATSKILKDNKNIINTIYSQLVKSGYTGTDAFRSILQVIISDFEATMPSPVVKTAAAKSKPSVSRSNSGNTSSSEQPSNLQSSTRRQLKAIASRFSATSNGKVPTLATQPSGLISMDSLSLHPQPARSRDQPSLSPATRTSPSLAASHSDSSLSPTFTHSRPLSVDTTGSSTSPLPTYKSAKPAKRLTMPAITNLDYLSFGQEPEQVEHGFGGIDNHPVKTEPQPTDWERLLCDLDSGPANLFDAPYNRVGFEEFSDSIQVRPQHSRAAISDAALAWNADLLSLQEMAQRKSKTSIPNGSIRTSNSHWSAISDESFGSSDGLSSTDWTSSSSNNDVPDTFTSLDLADIGVDFDFGTELEPDWQENLVNCRT